MCFVEETGLYYNRFRYYSPEAGQYVSRDPIGLLGGMRSAAYIEDPTTSFDPLALSCRKATVPRPIVLGESMKARVEPAAALARLR
ncbi:MAG: RHS repeat-associated core domain-containing protein [Myxococcales bacterium]|nr:RHS repeat-associated core domain-containing protein [Myxococcales bacterium]